jgi:titin
MKKILSILCLLVFAIASYGATVNVAWDASPSTGLSSYRVYKSTSAITAGTAPSANPAAVVAVTVPSTQLTGAIVNLTDGTWYFSVTAVDTSNLESLFSNVVSLNVINLPAAPTSLAATALSTSQIRLNWADNATNETGYVIERSSDNITYTALTTVGVGVITYTNTGLPANTLYYYRVKAINSAGSSAYTAVASARTLALTPPTAPTNLRIVSSVP